MPNFSTLGRRKNSPANKCKLLIMLFRLMHLNYVSLFNLFIADTYTEIESAGNFDEYPVESLNPCWQNENNALDSVLSSSKFL